MNLLLRTLINPLIIKVHNKDFDQKTYYSKSSIAEIDEKLGPIFIDYASGISFDVPEIL